MNKPIFTIETRMKNDLKHLLCAYVKKSGGGEGLLEAVVNQILDITKRQNEKILNDFGILEPLRDVELKLNNHKEGE